MKKCFVCLFVLLVGVSLAACAPAATPASTSVPTAAPQPTQVPTVAPAPTETAVISPVAPPTATTQPTAAQPATADPSGNVVELQFWHAQSQSQQKALNSLVDQFNSSHPGIKVVATYQGNYSDLYKKVTASIAAGAPPDLSIAYPDQVASYIQSAAVIPLDNLMKDPQIGFTSEDLNDIYPTFIDHYPQANNQVYSMAFMRSMEVMYYNVDMLKAAGYDKPPENWNQFMEICAAVSKPPDTYCYEMNTDASRFANWVWSRGGDLISPDGTTVAFDSQAGLETMDFINEMFTKNYAIVIGTAFQDQTDFALGKLAFTMGSTAGLPYYQQAIDQAGKVQNWDIAPDPHSTSDPVVDLYGPSVTIFKTTEEKERAAFVFLTWLMGTGPDSEWVKATQYFPARRSTTQALSDFIQANPLYGEALGWVQYGRTEPAIAAWEPIRTYIAVAMTAVANGKQTPTAALKDAANKANQLLAGQ
jgi:multiple sugar transport system substrate-binding protein